VLARFPTLRVQRAAAAYSEDAVKYGVPAVAVGFVVEKRPAAPDKGSAKIGARANQRAPKGHKTPTANRRGERRKRAAKEPQPVQAGAGERRRAKSKGGKTLELIGRPKGSTLEEIMKVTQWQAHSGRGFLPTAAKKHKLHIESRKTEAG